jgi:hypothetical protein
MNWGIFLGYQFMLDSLFELPPGCSEETTLAALSRASEIKRRYESHVATLQEQAAAAARSKDAEFESARTTTSFLMREVTRGLKGIEDALQSSAGMLF